MQCQQMEIFRSLSTEALVNPLAVTTVGTKHSFYAVYY